MRFATTILIWCLLAGAASAQDAIQPGDTGLVIRLLGGTTADAAFVATVRAAAKALGRSTLDKAAVRAVLVDRYGDDAARAAMWLDAGDWGAATAKQKAATVAALLDRADLQRVVARTVSDLLPALPPSASPFRSEAGEPMQRSLEQELARADSEHLLRRTLVAALYQRVKTGTWPPSVTIAPAQSTVGEDGTVTVVPPVVVPVTAAQIAALTAQLRTIDVRALVVQP